VPTDSSGIIRDMLKSIDKYAAVLLINDQAVTAF